MIMSGLHKDNENTFSESSKQLKDRLRLVEAEIESGNNDLDILKEARELLFTMARCKLISDRTARAHLKMLSSFF